MKAKKNRLPMNDVSLWRGLHRFRAVFDARGVNLGFSLQISPAVLLVEGRSFRVPWYPVELDLDTWFSALHSFRRGYDSALGSLTLF